MSVRETSSSDLSMLAAVFFLVIPAEVTAQEASAGELQRLIEGFAEVAEANFECDISILASEPRWDEFARKWLTHYSAVGSGCDEASQELNRQSLAHDILFARRPTLDQLTTIIRPMIRSVESAYACDITLHGTPRIDSISGQWSVAFLGSGEGCEGAEDDLRDQGRALQIFFMRLPSNQALMR